MTGGQKADRQYDQYEQQGEAPRSLAQHYDQQPRGPCVAPVSEVRVAKTHG